MTDILRKQESRLGKQIPSPQSQFEIFLNGGKAKLTWKKIISVLKYLQLQLGFVFFLNSLNQMPEAADGKLSCAKS